MCTCGEGFEGDGITCTGKKPMNESTYNSGRAIVFVAMKTLTISFCYADIDECRSDALNNCHKYAQCINIEGTFACSCYLGYIGDGRECTGTTACNRNVCVPDT